MEADPASGVDFGVEVDHLRDLMGLHISDQDARAIQFVFDRSNFLLSLELFLWLTE